MQHRRSLPYHSMAAPVWCSVQPLTGHMCQPMTTSPQNAGGHLSQHYHSTHLSSSAAWLCTQRGPTQSDPTHCTRPALLLRTAPPGHSCHHLHGREHALHKRPPAMQCTHCTYLWSLPSVGCRVQGRAAPRRRRRQRSTHMGTPLGDRQPHCEVAWQLQRQRYETRDLVQQESGMCT